MNLHLFSIGVAASLALATWGWSILTDPVRVPPLPREPATATLALPATPAASAQRTPRDLVLAQLLRPPLLQWDASGSRLVAWSRVEEPASLLPELTRIGFGAYRLRAGARAIDITGTPWLSVFDSQAQRWWRLRAGQPHAEAGCELLALERRIARIRDLRTGRTVELGPEPTPGDTLVATFADGLTLALGDHLEREGWHFTVTSLEAEAVTLEAATTDPGPPAREMISLSLP